MTGRHGGINSPPTLAKVGQAHAMKRKAAKRRRPPDKIINNLYEAKLNLSRLVDRAAAGEEVVIAKNGKPMARLVPLPAKKKRVPGGWAGKVWIADDFDDPLPEDILKSFYESELEPSS